MQKKPLKISLILALCTFLILTTVPMGNCTTTLAYSKAFADADNDWLTGANDNLCVSVTGNGQFLHSLILSIKEYTLEGNVVGDIYGIVFSNATNILEATSPMDESVLDGTYRNCSFIFSGTLFLVSGVTYYVGIHVATTSSRIKVAEDNGAGACYYHSPDLLLAAGQTPVYAIYTSDTYGSGGGGSYADVVYNGLGLYIYGSPHYTVNTLCVPNAIHTCDQGEGYGLTGQIFNNYVENTTAAGIFNVTWIGLKYTLGEQADPTAYSTLQNGVITNGLFSFDMWCDEDESGQVTYTAVRVNYTLTGETEVSTLYMFKFEPDLYFGWTPTPIPSATATPPGWTESDQTIEEFANFMVPLVVMLVPSVLMGYVFKMGKWGYIIGLLIGSGLGWMFVAGFPPWLMFLVVIGTIGFAYDSFRRKSD